MHICIILSFLRYVLKENSKKSEFSQRKFSTLFCYKKRIPCSMKHRNHSHKTVPHFSPQMREKVAMTFSLCWPFSQVFFAFFLHFLSFPSCLFTIHFLILTRQSFHNKKYANQPTSQFYSIMLESSLLPNLNQPKNSESSS